MKNRFGSNTSLQASKHADTNKIFVVDGMKARSKIASILKASRDEQSNNAIELLKYWDGSDSFIRNICDNNDIIFKEVKQILLDEVIIDGDLEGDDDHWIGLAQLSVRGKNSEQTLKFFRPLVEDFAHVWIDEENEKEYWEALTHAKSGNFEPFVLFLRKFTHSASIPVPHPLITLEKNGMTYSTASGGCEISIDMANNLVWFRKLDINQGTGPYSYMRGGYFLNNIIRELYREVKNRD